MFRNGKTGFQFAGPALAMSLAFGVSSPAQAQASDAALGEFHRACASQINRYRQSGLALGGGTDDTDQRFGLVMSFSGATREGLQRVDAEVTARVQGYVADTAAAREYSVAAGELDHCAVRVGLRLVSGGVAQPPRVVTAPPTPRPAAPAPRVASPATPPRAPSAPVGPVATTNAAISLLRTDLEAGLRALNRLEAEGNPYARYALGVMYWEGRGVVRDPARGLLFMRQAAAQNVRQAIQRLPAMEQQARQEANAGGMAAAGPAPTPARRETRVHNPALVATQCVHVRPYGEPDSRGYSQSIVNECGRVVEVSWCSTDGECERNSGNSWTLAASGQGSAYPVGRNPVRYGACLGRNSGGFEQGSQGQRIICTGEAGARPR